MTSCTISNISTVLSEFKSAKLLYSPLKTKLTANTMSCILTELSPLISPNVASKLLKTCHPALGCETISPVIFVAVIKYSINEFEFRAGNVPIYILSDSRFKATSPKGPSSALYFQCSITDCKFVSELL